MVTVQGGHGGDHDLPAPLQRSLRSDRNARHRVHLGGSGHRLLLAFGGRVACPICRSRGRRGRWWTPLPSTAGAQHLSLRYTWPGLESWVTKRNTEVPALSPPSLETGLQRAGSKGSHMGRGQSHPGVPQTGGQGQQEALQSPLCTEALEPASLPGWEGSRLPGRARRSIWPWPGSGLWGRCVFKPWHPAEHPGMVTPPEAQGTEASAENPKQTHPPAGKRNLPCFDLGGAVLFGKVFWRSIGDGNQESFTSKLRP